MHDQLAAFVHKHAGHLHLGLQLGQGVAGVLVIAHSLAKHLAVLHVLHRPVDGRLRCRNAANRDLQALPGQLLHQTNEALALHGRATQQLVGADLDVVKK